MQKYTFKIENPPAVEIYINIVAKTPAEAVAIANEALSDAAENESEPLNVSYTVFDASLVFKPNVRVDEKMIVHQEDISGEDLIKAHDFLTAKGYSFEGDFDSLLTSDEPSFSKGVYTEDGTGIYAILKVAGRFKLNVKRVGFRIEAILYPVGLSQLKEHGTLHYGVHFWDRQAWTTIDDLPNALEHYEEKFMELIMALRKADPFDGLPIPDDELK